MQAVRDAVGIPVLANGNILSRADADACMAYTGAQGVLSAGLFPPDRLLYETAGMIRLQDTVQLAVTHRLGACLPNNTALSS